MIFSLSEQFKVVQLANPKTTNGGFTSDYISLKGALKAFLLCEMTQAVGHATQLSPYQATVVAGTDGKVLTAVTPIWSNEDTGTDDDLAPQTAAKNYSVTNDIANKTVIFEIDPAVCMDLANSFDCLAVVVADSSQATNFCSITAILVPRYAGKPANQPDAITD